MEGFIQRVRDVSGQRPGPVRGGQQVVFAGTESYCRFDQLGEAAQRVVRVPGVLDRRCELLGDALIQGRSDQVGLGRKPAIERSFTDSGMTGDGFDGRIGPELAVDGPRGAQYALGVAGGVGS